MTSLSKLFRDAARRDNEDVNTARDIIGGVMMAVDEIVGEWEGRMNKIQEVKKKILDSRDWRHYPEEYEQYLNGLSHELIEAYAEVTNGACLGSVNIYGETPAVIITRHENPDICNFGASFVLPGNTRPENVMALEKLIRARADRPEYPGASADAVLVNEIFDMVEALGGSNLHWV